MNVFETFLPQLLLYPNPTDPLNGEAAALLMREPDAYNKKVKGSHFQHPYRGHAVRDLHVFVRGFLLILHSRYILSTLVKKEREQS